MLLNDLDKLVRDNNQEGLYNLFAKTYKFRAGVKENQYVVGPEEEMRMDLVSFSIYESIDHVDFLCNYNSIDNPLNVMAGDVIQYVPLDTIDEFIDTEPADSQVSAGLLNENKKTQKDPKRSAFLENDYKLPPTFLDLPRPAIQVIGNTLVIE